MSDLEFLNHAELSFETDSALRFLILSLLAYQRGDMQELYYWADRADRQVFASMFNSRDYSRASLYSFLASDLKYLVLADICDEGARCSFSNPLGILPQFAEDVGIDYGSIDYGRYLHCLLRVDGYITPIEVVIGSTRFQECFLKS